MLRPINHRPWNTNWARVWLGPRTGLEAVDNILYPLSGLEPWTSSP
jgi:hypothetical protein